MSRVHRVRTHHWRNGRLEVKDWYFDNAGDAKDFADGVEDASSVKVYSHADELIHTVNQNPTNTYA